MPPRRKKPNKSRALKKRKVVSRRKVKIKMEEVELGDEPIDYVCGLCSSKFDSKNDLDEHIMECKQKSLLHLSSITMKTNIKCNKCPKIFKFKKNFLLHCKNEHSKTPGSMSCPECHVRCPNIFILSKHIDETHKRDEYECPYCKKTFVRRAHVLRHISQSGCNGTKAAEYPCEICSASFSRKDNLIVHLRFQHILRSVYNCKHCNFSTKNFSKLAKHWQENHVDPLKYECDICGKATSTRTSIAKHLEIHGEKKHSCDVCGYSTFTAEVLKRHVLTHVKDKPHKCNICGQSYIQRLQLQRHLEKHTGNICTKCGQNFPTKARLLVHERTHKGLKKLQCPFEDCSMATKEFISEANLHSHVKSHLLTKDYKCEVCNKAFHAEANMRRHVSTHRLDRPRRCMYCVAARAYIRGEQLLRHVRKDHPDLFRQHLAHVRQVLGTNINVDRVKKSELESILNVLDAESDRILEGYGGSDVLYGGVQEQDAANTAKNANNIAVKTENALMSEDELVEKLKLLLSQLIDKETLECFGWPDENIDTLLEKVIEQCGARVADRERWTRVQCLRENTKHLFLYAVEDKNIARMLDTHTIDQVIKHILAQVSEDSA